MESKSDMVRKLVAEGEYKKALRIVKGFRLGITKKQSDILIRGYECLTNPRFYTSIGLDPDTIAGQAVATLITLYGI